MSPHIPFLFEEIDLIKNELNYKLNERVFHHLINVLKIAENDQLEVASILHQNCYLYQIKNINKKKFEFELHRLHESFDYKNKLNYIKASQSIHVIMPLLKQIERTEWCIEKLVELGISHLYFTHFERSQMSEKIFETKKERLEKIAISAAKQARRPILKQNFIQYIHLNNLETESNLIFLHPGGEKLKHITFKKDQKNYFIFGPEGGLTENELALISKAQKMTLGPCILRSETAPIVTCSFIVNSFF